MQHNAASRKIYFFVSSIIYKGTSNLQNLVAKAIYQVYVVELSKRVFTENYRFRNANPKWGESIIIKGKFYATCDYGC